MFCTWWLHRWFSQVGSYPHGYVHIIFIWFWGEGEVVVVVFSVGILWSEFRGNLLLHGLFFSLKVRHFSTRMTCFSLKMTKISCSSSWRFLFSFLFLFFFDFIMICHICHPFALRGRNFHSPSALKEPSVYLSCRRKMRAFSPTALINVRLHGSVEYIRGPAAQGLLTPGLAWERSKFTSTFASAHVKAKKRQISARGRKKTSYVDADVAFFYFFFCFFFESCTFLCMSLSSCFQTRLLFLSLCSHFL